MCSPMTCSSCGRPSYSGCGNHVEQVLGHVPQDQRCQCRSAGAGDVATAGAKRPWTALLGR